MKPKGERPYPQKKKKQKSMVWAGNLKINFKRANYAACITQPYSVCQISDGYDVNVNDRKYVVSFERIDNTI